MINQTLLSCSNLLIDNQLTISFAESATAGRVSSDFSLLPDAGKFLKGGVVCYDADLKKDMLSVPQDMIDSFTPESMEVTEAITIGLENLIKSDISIGITGLTAPGGSETEEKPVGSMFIHCRYHSKTLFSEKKVFRGSPETIIVATVEYIAKVLYHHLLNILPATQSVGE